MGNSRKGELLDLGGNANATRRVGLTRKVVLPKAANRRNRRTGYSGRTLRLTRLGGTVHGVLGTKPPRRSDLSLGSWTLSAEATAYRVSVLLNSNRISHSALHVKASCHEQITPSFPINCPRLSVASAARRCTRWRRRVRASQLTAWHQAHRRHRSLITLQPSWSLRECPLNGTP